MSSMTRTFLLVVLLTAGCSTSPPVSPQPIPKDTANVQRESPPLTPPIPNPGPAPGTVVLVVSPLGCDDADATLWLCRFKVEEIRAYGSATPALDSNQTLEASVSSHLLSSGESLLKGEGRFVVTLQHSETLGDEPSWRVLALAAR